MRQSKGQVAIFVVLVFHVFFIFFAMVVNVGLLVFHKINLQNSVDLAAYYAGMKQAEALNVIAHTNYQMRQSWKLLNFRYRGLGMAGNQAARMPISCSNAYNPSTCTAVPPLNNADNAPYRDMCMVGFCGNYQSWAHLNTNESFCKNAGCGNTGAAIPVPGIPRDVLAGRVGSRLPSIVSQTIQFSITAERTQREQCQISSRANWILLGAYIFGYKWDMINRKLLIHGISQGLSQSQSDFLDLEGLSVREGALKTFEKNLTSPNLDGLGDRTKFRLTNSLALGGCGEITGGRNTPPAWLQPIHVRPLFRYLDANCGNVTESNPNSSIQPEFKYFTDSFIPGIQVQAADLVRASFPEYFNFIREYAIEPVEFNNPQQMLFASTVGFEKNPWCLAYTMIEAESTPKIPFSPLGSITLKARAIAKPFGGSIGPWYSRDWPIGSQNSGNFNTPFDLRTDKHLTFRIGEGILNHYTATRENLRNSFGAPGSIPNPEAVREFEFMSPSHGRFVGDPSGLRAYNTNQAWLDGIFRLTLINEINRLNMNHWTQAVSTAAEAGDILSWDQNRIPESRKLEIEAILPDQFDLSYFSIESNFFDLYVAKLRKNRFLLDGFLGEYGNEHVQIRGDLGYRSIGTWNLEGHSLDLSRFSILNQYQAASNNRYLTPRPLTREHGHRIFGLGYLARGEVVSNSVPSLLTSWHLLKPGNYTFSHEKFGKCQVPTDLRALSGSPPETEATPGGCVSGGRSGYSVKLVDPQFLSEPMILGGPSGSSRILNPPPN